MRQEDRLEWYYASGCSFGLTPVSDLKDALCLYDDETHKVYAIGGVEGNIIWVVCTTEVDKHPVKFLRFCKPWFKEWVKYPVHNVVWLKNEKHIKWLAWLDATFKSTVRINGELFKEFILYPVKE